MSLSDLHSNLKSLIKRWVYDKDEVDELIGDINDFIDSDNTSPSPSSIVDSVTDNDMRAVTSNAVHDALGNIDLTDYIEKSSTTGLVKNDGTIDTNTYVTTSDSRLSDNRTPTSHTHGNLSNDGKIGSDSGKPLITTTGGAVTTGSFGTSSGEFAEGNHTHSNYLTSHNPVDSSLSSTSTNAVQNKVINTALSGKADSNHDHSGVYQPVGNYLTSHQDISGKIDTAGTGLSKSNTTLNHSNSVTALTTASLKKVKYDAQGHITGTSDVTGTDLPSHSHSYASSTHNHTSSEITDLSSTIATAIGNLELVEVVSSLPTSNIKNNKLYLVANSVNGANNKYDLYLRVGNDWEKIDSLDFAISDYIKKTSTDTGYLKSNGTIASLPTASTSNSGIVQLSSAVDSTSETVGATSKAVKLAYENIPSHNHDGTYLKTHQDITGKLDKAQGSTNASKNVVTDSNGNITVEAKPTIPSASSSTPSADVTGGAIGSSSNYAKADHQHPLSTAYATSGHTHNEMVSDESGIMYFTDDGSSINMLGDKIIYDYNGDVYGTPDAVYYLNSNYTPTNFDDFVTTDDSRLSNARTPTSHTHTKSQITDFPTLSSVATSGSYNDLTNKPTIPSAYTHPTPSGLGGAKTTGFYKISTDANGHVATVTSVTASDILALANIEIAEMVVTYTDETTETIKVLKYTGT